MTDGFRDAVEAAARTQLDRIGSSKLLVALTSADLSEDAVLRVAADSEAAAASVFESWAEDADTTDIADAYRGVAAAERDHLDRVLAELDDYEPGGRGAIHDHLLELEDPIERVAAGFVGRGLVAMRTHTQVISFFVNEQDRHRADLFRDLKSDTDDQIEDGVALLADLCRDENDRDRALDAAVAVIQTAYDEYAAALQGMGINPKSVC